MPSRRPPPLRHTVNHRQFTVTPSISAHPLCSRSIAAALALSLAVEGLSRRPLRRRGAVAPSLAVEEPSRRPLLSRTVAASCVARSLYFYFSFAVIQIFSPLAALPSCP